VSADAVECDARREPVQETLAELQASHDEFGQFFGDICDQLQRLSLEVLARHRALDLAAGQQAVHDGAASESCFQRLWEEVQQLRGDLATFHDETRQAWQEFRGIREEFDDARKQRDAWDQERARLESELEAARHRAEEMVEALAEQKRHVTQQQAEWAGELKRMRSLLESVSARVASDAGRPGGTAVVNDPVLDSVVAQFEMLQKDVARQRMASSKSVSAR
jgi:predicted  nucleic acid-binding Zn-ribbon protein